MGQVVSVLTTSHVLFPPIGVEDAAERVFQGMKTIGRRIRESNPDVLLLVSSDHLFNLNLNLQPPFVVGVADEYVPFGDMGVPIEAFPGHHDFAEGFLRFAAENGFDLTRADDLVPDHGVSIPRLFVDRSGKRIPTVPLLVNVTMSTPPSPARCWALGETLGKYIRQARPEKERVAILAAGGLSHWIGVEKQGHINEQFDRLVLERFAHGEAIRFQRMTGEELETNAGNGGAEICNWLVAAAAAGDCGGETVFYEAIGPWMTGMGGFAFHLNDQRQA